MRKGRVLTCSAIFLIMTVIKLISPAFAAQLKNELQPVLDQSDHYHRLIHRVERALHPITLREDSSFVLNPQLTEIRNTLERLSKAPLADIPKVERKAEPEDDINPVLEYGYQVREAFLNSQSQITDASPPENVSYDVLLLPFSESTPILGRTSSGFGYRMHPIQNEMRFHYGTDYAADAGTEIHAFADGIVAEAGISDGYGNYVKIDHGNGFTTLYAHCSELLIHEGDSVTRNQTIALVGSTGQSTGPHLHFELMHNGVYLNPEFYLYS